MRLFQKQRRDPGRTCAEEEKRAAARDASFRIRCCGAGIAGLASFLFSLAGYSPISYWTRHARPVAPFLMSVDPGLMQDLYSPSLIFKDAAFWLSLIICVPGLPYLTLTQEL